MISITEHFTDEEIARYASEVGSIHKHDVAWFEETFNDSLSDDYYQGLLSGLHQSAVFLKEARTQTDNPWWTPKKVEHVLKCIMAFVANEMQNKKETDHA